MKKENVIKTERNLYQVIGILGILAEMEANGDSEKLRKTIEDCALAAEGAKALLTEVAYEITEFCEKEG